MKEIIFRIENRYLLKLGWQACIAQALSSGGHHPGHIQQGAKLAHKPVPNKAQTIFYIFVVPEGQPDPILQHGKIRDFYEFMGQGKDMEAIQRENLIQQCIREQNQGVIIH